MKRVFLAAALILLMAGCTGTKQPAVPSADLFVERGWVIAGEVSESRDKLPPDFALRSGSFPWRIYLDLSRDIGLDFTAQAGKEVRVLKFPVRDNQGARLKEITEQYALQGVTLLDNGQVIGAWLTYTAKDGTVLMGNPGYSLQARDLEQVTGMTWPQYVRAAQPPSPRPWSVELDQVKWAMIRFGLPAEDLATPLYPERPADLSALTRIAQWLQDAKPAESEISQPSRADSLELRLKDGRTMTARLAYNCVTEKTADSTRMTCTQAWGEVIVYPPGGEPMRLTAPELAVWLLGGWRTDAPTAPAVEVTVLPNGFYRVQGNGWPEAEQMNIWLDGDGPNTCCPPSNGSRLAQVPVTFGRFLWEGEIPGTGRFGLTVVTEGGGARGISVERTR